MGFLLKNAITAWTWHSFCKANTGASTPLLIILAKTTRASRLLWTSSIIQDESKELSKHCGQHCQLQMACKQEDHTGPSRRLGYSQPVKTGENHLWFILLEEMIADKVFQAVPGCHKGWFIRKHIQMLLAAGQHRRVRKYRASLFFRWWEGLSLELQWGLMLSLNWSCLCFSSALSTSPAHLWREGTRGDLSWSPETISLPRFLWPGFHLAAGYLPL